VSTLLIRGGILLTGDPTRPVVDPGYVLVDDATIVDVGAGPPPDRAVDEVIDAADMLVTPGFVNAHTHLCMIFGRGLGADRALLSWLSEAQVPLMQQLQPADYRLAMELGAIENLKAGTTTVGEVFFSPHYDQEVDTVALTALDAAGIRSTLFRCSNDEAFFEGFVETRERVVERSERLIEVARGRRRTRAGVGPLIPWGSSRESFLDAVELSDRHGVGIHLHTAETPEYNDLVRDRTGLSNVEMLADVGALGPRTTLNHCVFVSERDIELIAEGGAAVVHDPTSNMLLASGVAPVPALRAAGVPLGLACDGPACNNGQDMIETMKAAALLHKAITRRPDALVAADVFEMATRGGARACGLDDVLGAIRPGLLADLVLIDTRVAHLTPLNDPMAALVYSARGGDVRTVVVDGQVVVRDGVVTTLNEAEVLARARERAARARRLAGV
jgi:5-methylthioadenosine/S-adenosylhomocysteine deaminase